MLSNWEEGSNWEPKGIENLKWFDTMDNRYRVEVHEDNTLNIYDHQRNDLLINSVPISLNGGPLWGFSVQELEFIMTHVENFIDTQYDSEAPVAQ